MCGIAGIYGKNSFSVQKMTDLMQHRGPDDQGFFADGKISLGHRRLSIIDLSEKGHQPMERGGLVIVYNGEIYNYIELRKELERKGYVFSSGTDTEVILFAFKEWGRKCLEKFNGMWAFAIWDKDKKELFCSRDRYGIKPFYYYSSGSVFAFASEIKPLLLFKKKPNEKAIFEYLTAELADYSEQTFFEDIKQLEPSSYMTVKDAGMSMGRYYDVSFNKDLGRISQRNLKEYAENFLDLLQDSVRLRLRSDVEVGSCLSGGLDSSAIVCLINKLRNGGQKTFTFFASGADEREYIKETLADKDIKPFYISSSSEEFWQDLGKVVLSQEEPFKSSSIYAQYKVMELAQKQGVKVLLDGQGSDELFGYPEQISSFLNQSFLNGRALPNFNTSFIRFFVPSSLLYYLRKKKIKSLNCIRPELKKKYRYNEAESKLAKINYQQALFEGLTGSGLRRLLRYEDKNSMAHSIESRLPFLDYRLVDFIFSLPAAYKINKLLQREALKGVIPEKVRLRKDKMGFVTPEEKWLRENKENIKRLFLKDNPYFEKEKVLNLLNKENAKLSELWRFINLELWLKKF
jgi:asparagine synthase (glutamine-hydrolysing)